MPTCPNLNDPKFQELKSSVGENIAYALWNRYEGEVPPKYFSSDTNTERLSKGGLDPISVAHTSLTTLANLLQKKFNIPYQVDYDFPHPAGLKNENGKRMVILNPNKASLSDGFHEYSHPFLMAIRQIGPEIFSTLYDDLANTPEWKTIYDRATTKVKKLYPEYDNDISLFKEEVLATALGYASEIKISERSEGFQGFIDKLLHALKTIINTISNIVLNTNSITEFSKFENVVKLMVDPNVKVDLADPINFSQTNQDIKEIFPNLQVSPLVKEIRKFNEEIADSSLPKHLKRALKLSEKPYVPKETSLGKPISMGKDLENSIPNFIYITDVENWKERIDSHIQTSLTERNIKNQLLSSTRSNNFTKITSFTEGDQFPISTKYLDNLYSRDENNRKIPLDKPFSSSEISDNEKVILSKFYDFYYAQIKDFFSSKGKPVPKTIDAPRLADKYRDWLRAEYPILHYFTPPQINTYGIDGGVDYDNLGKGYEVMISNGYLASIGHTYKMYEDDEFKKPISVGGSYNTLGWYIYYLTKNNLPIFYEFQSDIIDGDLESLFNTNKHTPQISLLRQYERLKDSIINIFASPLEEFDEDVARERLLARLNATIESMASVANYKKGIAIEPRVLDVLRDAVQTTKYRYEKSYTSGLYNYSNKIFWLLKNNIKALLKEESFDEISFAEKVLEKLSVTDYFEFRDMMLSKNISITSADAARTLNSLLKLSKAERVELKKINELNYKLSLDRLERAERTNKNQELIGEYLSKQNALQKERIKEAYLPLIEKTIQSLKIKAKKAEQDFSEIENTIEETKERILGELDTIYEDVSTNTNDNNNQVDPVLQKLYESTKALRSNQLKIFITHAILYAKQKGHKKVYFPSSDFIKKVESGKPWTLYVTPEDKKISDKFNNSHLGSFYEALMKIPNISYKYVKPQGVKAHLLEIDVSKLDVVNIERFSKSDNSTQQPRNTSHTETVLKTEQIKGLIREIKNIDGIKAMNYDKFHSVVSNYIWKKETDLISKNRSSVKVSGNAIYPIVPSSSRFVKNPDQLPSYARSIADQINKKHFGDIFGGIATYREYPIGKVWVEPSFNSKYTKFLFQSINTEFDEEIDATMALIESQELLDQQEKEWQARQAEGNYIEVDGEILPVDTKLYQHMLQSTMTPNQIKYKKILDKLASRFDGAEWEWDNTIGAQGNIDMVTKRIKINSDKADPDTPWHEFGHIFVRGIKNSNPELFESLKKDVMRQHEKHKEFSAYTIVTELYPHLIGTETFWEEAITKELGFQAVEKKGNIFKTIWDWFLSRFRDYSIPNLKTNLTISQITDIFKNEFLTFDVDTVDKTNPVMENRITPEGNEQFKGKFVENFDEVYKQLVLDLKEKDWNKIVDITKQLFGTRSKDKLTKGTLSLPERALERIIENSNAKQYITPELVAEAMLDLSDYLNKSAIYLKSIRDELTSLIENESISERHLLASLFHTKQIADIINIEAGAFHSKLLSGSLPDNHPFRKGVYNVNALYNDITRLYNDNLKDKVATVQSEHFKPQTDKIIAEKDREIAKFEKLKESRPKDAAYYQKKINALIKEKTLLPTKENLKKMLDNPTDSKWPALYNMFKSATYVKDLSVQSIAEYINDIIRDAEREYFDFLNKTQTIFEDIIKEVGNTQGMDVQKLYRPYQRIVEEVFVNYKDKEEPFLDKRQVLVLNSQMDIQRLQNEITTYRFNINNNIDVEHNQEELEKLIEKYTERYHTDEYYNIQKLLPKEIRNRRSNIYKEINLILEEAKFEPMTQDQLETLRTLHGEISDMERLYDANGIKKTGSEETEALQIQEWKAAKREHKVDTWKLTPDAKKAFKIALDEQKAKLNSVLNNVKSTPQDKEAATEAYNNWTSNFARTVYAEEFYDAKSDIMSQISEIYEKYDRELLTDAYGELSQLLKGYKDGSYIYDGTRANDAIKIKVKALDEEIEKLKDIAREEGEVSAADKEKLQKLFRKLDNLQASVNTDYYNKVRKQEFDKQYNIARIAHTRAGAKMEDIHTLSTIDATKNLMQTEWYKNNHIVVTKYINGQLTEVDQPTSIWRTTMPKDEDYILKEEPSLYWYEYEVNPHFKNDKFVPYETTFKYVPGDYENAAYKNLNDKQKDILNRLTSLYLNNLQGELYKSFKLGLKIPQIRKEGTEQLVDILYFRDNPTKAVKYLPGAGFLTRVFHTIRDTVKYGDPSTTETNWTLGNSNQTDIAGNPVSEENKRLYMRYTRTLPINEVSHDLLKSISIFGNEATRFKHLRRNQSYILSARQAIKPSSVKKILDSYIDRIFYGEFQKTSFEGDSKIVQIGKGIEQMANIMFSKAGGVALDYNLPSIGKNYFSGIVFPYFQNHMYGLDNKDLQKGLVLSARHSPDYFISEMQAGNKTYELRLLDYFNVLQKSAAHQGEKVKNTVLRKYGNIPNVVKTIRDFSEFEIQSTMGFAILGKVTYNKKGSKETVPFLRAYEVVDNELRLRPDIEPDEDKERMVRSWIENLNVRTQGLYKQHLQPHAQKFILGRLVLFMRKYMVPAMESQWESKKVLIGSGIEVEGLQRAFFRMFGDIIANGFNVNAVMAGATEAEKKALKSGLQMYTTLTVAILLSALAKSGADDDDPDGQDYLAYFLASTTDELEGMTPLTAFHLGYEFAYKKSNGKSWETRLIVDRGFGPVKRLGAILTDKSMYTMDPYYKYNRGKINWDMTNPFYEGMPGLAVLFGRYYGLEGLNMTPLGMEFKSRQFSSINPKFYLKEKDTKYIENYKKKKIKRQDNN